MLHNIYPEGTLLAQCRLSRYDFVIQKKKSDMSLVDYLLTRRNKTFVSRERVASFLNFVPVEVQSFHKKNNLVILAQQIQSSSVTAALDLMTEIQIKLVD